MSGIRAGLTAIEKLSVAHETSAFSCGKPALDSWLRRFALTNQASDSARTYVVCRGTRVVGYFSISAGSVERDEVPARIAKGLARHPVPVVLLARLAVDLGERGKGLGAALLKDALLRIAQGAEILGARAVLVHALDDEARRFCEHLGFDPSPLDPLQLFLLLKDLRKNLGR
jgi:GNAT superfamily N-acetyltransferase